MPQRSLGPLRLFCFVPPDVHDFGQVLNIFDIGYSFPINFLVVGASYYYMICT